MNTSFTYDEICLMCLYNDEGTRAGLIEAIRVIQDYITEDEAEVRAITESVLDKLEAMTDEAFADLDLTPDIFD